MKLEFRTINNYINNGNHVQIVINDDLPFKIEKGADHFWYFDGKGIEKKSKPNLWYLHFEIMYEHFVKGFKSPEKAYIYGISTYQKWLKKEFVKIRNIVAEI